MRLWPGRSEQRAGATDTVITALLAQASGAGAPPTAGALAAVETAAGSVVPSLGVSSSHASTTFPNTRSHAVDTCQHGPGACHTRRVCPRPGPGRRRLDADTGESLGSQRRDTSRVMAVRYRAAVT